MAKLSISQFLHSQLILRKLPLQKSDLSGQTVVITGANTGLGFEAAKHIAGMNPQTLVFAVRNPRKGEEALATLRRDTGYTGGAVMHLDMNDFASVSEFASQFSEKYHRLDVLILNAGVFNYSYNISPNGWESTIQVNVLSTALLGFLFLPIMERTSTMYNSNPAMTFIGSEMHKAVNFLPTQLQKTDIMASLSSDPDLRSQGAMIKRYNESKLLLMFFVRSFTSHLAPSSRVLIDIVDPGYCKSGLNIRDTNRGHLISLTQRVFQAIFARDPVEGAKAVVWAALAGRNDPTLHERLHGGYSRDCDVESEPGDNVISQQGQEMQRKLWKEMVEILSNTNPQVQECMHKYLS